MLSFLWQFSFTSPTPNYRHRKVVLYYALWNDTVDYYEGHGTHVAGSIAGNCPQLAAHNGGAPQARIAFVVCGVRSNHIAAVFLTIACVCVFDSSCARVYTHADCPSLLQDIGDSKSKSEIRLPLSLTDYIYQPVYDAGARIHAEAWGGAPEARYTFDSWDMDQFSWQNPVCSGTHRLVTTRICSTTRSSESDSYGTCTSTRTHKSTYAHTHTRKQKGFDHCPPHHLTCSQLHTQHHVHLYLLVCFDGRYAHG